MNPEIVKKVVEAALLASGKPLNIDRLMHLFAEGDFQPEKNDIRKALTEISDDCVNRGVELKEIASGFRMQVREDMAPWVSRLWEEKPQRYTRALLETLALIAYRQPATRGEIENVRGVAVSSNIIKTLTEREWIKVVGYRDVPGKPAMYGTTKEFLDYFNLKSLDELPSLAELRDFETINAELDLQLPGLEIAPEDKVDAAPTDSAAEEVAEDTNDEVADDAEASDKEVVEDANDDVTDDEEASDDKESTPAE
ncbi:MAG: SMC-Scp complex subunit ScpB [Sulfuriflexus sp.]|nr:SMC-Scp complex subunit ScpB [Sulfuriflexus sp.]